MNHLREEEIAALLVEGKQPAIDVSHCEECIAELTETRHQFEDVQQAVAAAAERDDIFWARQRASIRQRIKPPIGIRLEWVASLAALVTVAALLVGSGPKVPQQINQSNQSDPDYVLLAQIQQTLARPVPHAVEPMRLLASDMDRAYREHLQQAKSSKRDQVRR